MTIDKRAVEAVANAIDAALDSWDLDGRHVWEGALIDSRAAAEAIIKLLPQFGYAVSAILPEDPGE
jgi:hypothetical protein